VDNLVDNVDNHWIAMRCTAMSVTRVIGTAMTARCGMDSGITILRIVFLETAFPLNRRYPQADYLLI
jgi:hypothetical protein